MATNTGVSSCTTRPVVRFVIPDFELGTVVEEAVAVEPGDDDNVSDNVNRKENQIRDNYRNPTT